MDNETDSGQFTFSDFSPTLVLRCAGKPSTCTPMSTTGTRWGSRASLFNFNYAGALWVVGGYTRAAGGSNVITSYLPMGVTIRTWTRRGGGVSSGELMLL